MLLVFNACLSSVVALMLANAPSPPYKPPRALPRRTFQPAPSPPNLLQRPSPSHGPPRDRRRRRQRLRPSVASSRRGAHLLECALPRPTVHALFGLGGVVGAQPRRPAGPTGADECRGDIRSLLGAPNAGGAERPAVIAGQRPSVDGILLARA
jgi:hypothetical protein